MNDCNSIENMELDGSHNGKLSGDITKTAGDWNFQENHRESRGNSIQHNN